MDIASKHKNVPVFFGQSVTQIPWAFASFRAVLTDVFDTLILRTVHPENTKRLAARRLVSLLGTTLSAEEIYQLRSSLEREACRLNEQAGYDLEFRFDESFVDRLYDELGAQVPAGALGSRESFRECCTESELGAELSVQELDENVLGLLLEARNQGIPVYAVSDFYWPETLMRRMFEHHGLLELFAGYFISSEHKVTKRSGRLYEIVLLTLGLAPERILMIGDNEHSDIHMAREKGLKAHHLDRSQQRHFYEQAMRLADTKALIPLLLQTLRDSSIQHAKEGSFFPEFALTLYSFIEKLHIRLLKNGVRNVFFLSREGEFLKYLFDLYQVLHQVGPRAHIKTHYLLVSRKSTFIASLEPLETESFETLFRQYRAITLRDFLQNLNFQESEIVALAQALKVDSEVREADFPSCAAFQALKANERFQEIYNFLRTQQNTLFKRYLANFGVDIESEGLHLVDVGWKGTIQDHLHRLFQGQLSIHGYYLGLISEGAAGPINRKQGLLFSLVNAHSEYFAVYNDNRPLFEILLGASHGSAERYIERDGHVEVMTHDLEQECFIFRQEIQPLQRVLEAMFRDISSLLSLTHFTTDDFNDVVAKNHARFTFLPTEAEMAFFARLHHFENFGMFGTSRFSVTQELPLMGRLKNLYRLARAPRQTLQSGWWPPLTLNQLGLGLLRPIYGQFRFNRTFPKGQP